MYRPGFGGHGGGYNDPMGSGQYGGGSGFPMYLPTGAGGVPGSDVPGGRGFPGALSGAMQGVGKFLTGNEGANLANVVGAATNIYGAHRASRDAREQREEERRREEESRRRHDSWSPMRGQAIGKILTGMGQGR